MPRPLALSAPSISFREPSTEGFSRVVVRGLKFSLPDVPRDGSTALLFHGHTLHVDVLLEFGNIRLSESRHTDAIDVAAGVIEDMT